MIEFENNKRGPFDHLHGRVRVEIIWDSEADISSNPCSPGIVYSEVKAASMKTNPSSYSVKLVRSGHEYYENLDGEVIRLGMGQVGLVSGNQEVLATTERSQVTKGKSIFLRDGFDKHHGKQSFSMPALLDVLPENAPYANALHEAAEHPDGPIASLLVTESLVTDYLSELTGIAKQVLSKRKITQMRRARALLHAATRVKANHTPDWELGDLAKELGTTYSELSRQFRAAMGVSLQRYRQACRITAAARAIVNSKETAESISVSFGYRDYASFSRAFFRCTGMWPSQFRRCPDFRLFRINSLPCRLQP